MEALHALLPYLIFHGQQNVLVVLRPADAAQRAGIEVAEIDAGQQAVIQPAQLHDLLQRAQLVKLAHNLRADDDVPQMGLIQRCQRLL